MIQIDVYSDMVCPWCRIGKKNLQDALAAWDHKDEVEIRFRAFQLDSTLPTEGLPFHDAMIKKMGGNAASLKQMTDRVSQAGEAVGVPFRFDQVTRMPNTQLAHRLVALLPASEQEAMVDAIMTAYFEQGQDIAQLDILLDIAATCGHDPNPLREKLAQGQGTDKVTSDEQEARQIGVTGVPFFVFNNRYALSGAYPPAELIKILEKVATE
ncbi:MULTISPECIES: DsbA family oxidoreductase [unclassified Paenibacillus]|uniref:DsbA family oxidoreductase n=1 Tax=unclassified Paenibacillus TaxID=185978 RepID=UPI001B602024|nr:MULTISPECIES: DsbA family oxidoreductase [unclassified Paenibacillus]MBP1153366.1 putative DsbA family dithiol-disulfide isomerase [Paenibacillus sp. PvP091]MBP1171251.1 putative DsbA family dithiol-disulfide isomerase [Paenibacillus sp. PvR098]MBP2442279.1 putative DsbA family dithiol-disulfide isomerase [Paenibacillus sp. PvP052]